MALPELRGVGRLLTDPHHGTGKSGKPWCSALIKFSSWRKVNGTWVEGEGTVASVMTFEDNAAELARYAKGDPIGIHGTVKAAVWKDKPQLGITATQIWTPENAATSGSQQMSIREAASAAGATLRRFDASRTGSAA